MPNDAEPGAQAPATRIETKRELSPPTSFDSIGDYQILRKLGQGGMGVVYEAKHLALNRRVALKLLPGGHQAEDIAVQRFLREARSAAALHHTNIVPVFDVGSENNFHYYAMQLIEGASLNEVLASLEDVRRTGGSLNLKTPSTNDSNESLVIASRLIRSLEEIDTQPSAANHLDDHSTAVSLGEQESAHSRSTERSIASPLPQMNTVTEQETPVPDSETPVHGPQEGDRGQDGKPSASTTTTRISLRNYYERVAELGIQVAEALEYAHSKGIVHRDIKPANLMLDQDANVWVTDFGLAKTLEDDLTRSGGIVGTLRYMSPERFRGLCDGRSDIYALGITLYEMLVLRPAFPSRDHVSLMESIQNEEIPKLRSIERQVPRDLDTIISKATEKDPDRRYATAGEMASDLRRFVHGQPIHARQVSLPERMLLWAKNNRAIAALSSALLISLVLGLVASTYLAVVAESRADVAEEGQRVAANQTQVALESLQSVIYSVQVKLKSIPEAREVRRELLTDVVEDLEKVADDFSDASVVSRDSAKALTDLSDIVLQIGGELGTDVRALNRKYHRQAVDTYLKLVTESPDDLQLLRETAESLRDFGDIAREFQEFETAIWAHENNLQVAERIIELSVTDAEQESSRLFLIQATEALGEALIRSDQRVRAGELARQAVRLAEEYCVDYPTVDGLRVLALTYTTLGDLNRLQKQFDKAEAAYLKMQATSLRVVELAPDIPDNPDMISCDYERLGDLEFARENYPKALEHYERMLEYSEQYMAADPENLFRMKQSTWAYQKLAKVCTVLGDEERAKWCKQQLAKIRKRLKGSS